MHAGGRYCQIRDVSFDDRGEPAVLSSQWGWFVVRILTDLSKEQVEELRAQGIEFRSIDFISSGWFVKYLNQEMVTYIQTHPGMLGLFDWKANFTPNFDELDGDTWLVQACEDWNPQPPVRIKGKAGPGLYTVTGGSPREIWTDGHVHSIYKNPKIVLY
jgi:hypothetical protein